MDVALTNAFVPLVRQLDEQREEVDVASALLANQLDCLLVSMNNCAALVEAPPGVALGVAGTKVENLRRRLEAVHVKIALIAERLRQIKRRLGV